MAWQSNIDATFATRFNLPEVYYTWLIAVAYVDSAKEAAYDGQITRAHKQGDSANK